MGHCPEDVPIPVWSDNRIHSWAYVSATDYCWVKAHRWWLSDGYACRTMYDDGRKTSISLHREIMGMKPGWILEVDHIDRDRLHACRSNLRIVTRLENEQNKPTNQGHYRGTTQDQRTGMWKAQASWNGQYVYLGVYPTREAAATARAQWELAVRDPAIDAQQLAEQLGKHLTDELEVPQETLDN